MTNIKTKIVLVIALILSTISLWYIFVRQIEPHKILYGCNRKNCNSKDCIGHDCITTDCVATNCKAGDCMGEYCKAGNCVGHNCKAGDCYGYGCKPGICIDPECPKNECLQRDKQCIDGKAYILKESRWMGFKKYLSKNTMLNPPICRDSLNMDDIKLDRLRDLDIKTIYFENRGGYPYNEIMNKNISKRLNSVNITIPNIYRNRNCDICINGKCKLSRPIKVVRNNKKITEWKL